MKTDQLISALAADAVPVSTRQADRRFVLNLLLGAVASAVAMQLFLGVRPDLATAALLPMFWVKLAFPASLAGVAAVGLWRLGHPGVRLGRVAVIGGALPVAMLWALAGAALVVAEPAQRLALILGRTWLECLVSIAMLSIPVLWIALRAVRALAPTRPALAGGCAGLFAGAAAAFAYALHCPELQAPFLAVWYVAGMLVPSGVGTLVGRRLLHW